MKVLKVLSKGSEKIIMSLIYQHRITAFFMMETSSYILCKPLKHYLSLQDDGPAHLLAYASWSLNKNEKAYMQLLSYSCCLG